MADRGEKTEGKTFLSGVVEGFYGRPWTQDQRKDLFGRLNEMNLNTYMYAPKDDALHRKLWRQLYDDTEKENLATLIKSARSKGIKFVYAVSPGLDIIFSCPKDIQFLKNKLKQVADVGCEAFAILFDDIEPELSLPDKQDFESFADAQVTITNSVFEYLGKPESFLFCPTEYCSTRAKPSIEKSEYLNTLGAKLNSHIDVLWTGPKVVPRDISVSSIESVSKVLRRKPVIWDNSHANDYDQRRIFLGPYDGRPTELYKHLNGVFSNPNCEYESNFVALYTIAHWLKCCTSQGDTSPDKDAEMLDKDMKNDVGDVRAGLDVEMEMTDTQSSDTIADNLNKKEKMEILEEQFDKEEEIKTETEAGEEPSEQLKEIIDNIGYDSKVALDMAVSLWVEEFQKVKSLHKKNLDLYKSPSKLAVLECANSLSEPMDDDDDNDDDKNQPEEYEVVVKSKAKELPQEEENCCSYHASGKRMRASTKKENHASVTKKDLLLMIHLFFLPYEHGEMAKHLVSEFKWIQGNAPPVETEKINSKSVEEWERRAADYRKICQDIVDMFNRVSHAPNKPLVQELYPYILDVKDVSMLLDAFVKWLGSKSRKCKAGTTQIPEDPEPWMCKGGIVEELERLLPVDMTTELSSTSALAQSPSVYTVRPYLESDKAHVLRFCLDSYENELNDNGLFPNYPEMPGDRFLGAFLQNSKETTVFLLDDDDGICGYCVGVFDAKDFIVKSNAWLVEVSKKYDSSLASLSTHEGLFLEAIGQPTHFMPPKLHKDYPGQILISLLPKAQVTRIGQRLLRCVTSMMKSSGVNRVYCQVSSWKRSLVKLLKDVGFVPIELSERPPDHLTIFGINL